MSDGGDASTVLAPDGDAVRIVELSHHDGMSITVMDWGATWLSCRVPLEGTCAREILLGCQRIGDYFTQTAYLGAMVGRYANRIKDARISHEGHAFCLAPNEGSHQLHGGSGGFHCLRWTILEQGTAHVSFGIVSQDGDQGFPGTLKATVRYVLEGGGRVRLEYSACVDAPCPVNLTNHAYFNLDGMVSDIRRHELQICAARYLPVNPELIPSGGLADVRGSSFDFIEPKQIGRDFLTDEQQRQASGYDHAYLLDPECCTMGRPAATLVSSDRRVAMDVFTTKPAIQFYSGNYLSGVPSRDGGVYSAYQGLALETQFLPDSPNHPEWPQPDCWLIPGQEYHHSTMLVFRTKS